MRSDGETESSDAGAPKVQARRPVPTPTSLPPRARSLRTLSTLRYIIVSFYLRYSSYTTRSPFHSPRHALSTARSRLTTLVSRLSCFVSLALALVSRIRLSTTLLTRLSSAHPTTRSIRLYSTYRSTTPLSSPSPFLSFSLSPSLTHSTPLEHAQGDSSHLRISLTPSVGPSPKLLTISQHSTRRPFSAFLSCLWTSSCDLLFPYDVVVELQLN